MRNPVFPGVRTPSIDMQAVRDGRRSVPLYFQYALDTARSIANGITSDVTDVSGKALQLNVAGNAWWSDPIYDSAGNYIAGVVVAHFQDTALGSGVSTPITILPNSAQRVPFTTITLENFAQAGKKARIVYGVDIDFTPGFNAVATVAIDNPTIREMLFNDLATRAAEAFDGYDQQAAVVGQNSQVQLWNPSAATFTYVDRIRIVNSSAALSGGVRQFATALGTAGAAVVNKNYGSAVGNSLIKKSTNVGLQGALARAFATTGAGADQVLEFKPPIRLPQNQGVVVGWDGLNLVLNVAFEFRERTT